MKKKTSKEKLIDVIKATKKGLRDAELETSTGFTSINKIHRSKKTYTRKKKHKEKD